MGSGRPDMEVVLSVVSIRRTKRILSDLQQDHPQQMLMRQWMLQERHSKSGGLCLRQGAERYCYGRQKSYQGEKRVLVCSLLRRWERYTLRDLVMFRRL